MDRTQFRERMARADIDLTLLTKLTGYNRKHAIMLGARRPVPRSAVAIVEAYYLMDGPKRHELLKAIETGDRGQP